MLLWVIYGIIKKKLKFNTWILKNRVKNKINKLRTLKFRRRK